MAVASQPIPPPSEIALGMRGAASDLLVNRLHVRRPRVRLTLSAGPGALSDTAHVLTAFSPGCCPFDLVEGLAPLSDLRGAKQYRLILADVARKLVNVHDRRPGIHFERGMSAKSDNGMEASTRRRKSVIRGNNWE